VLKFGAFHQMVRWCRLLRREQHGRIQLDDQAVSEVGVRVGEEVVAHDRRIGLATRVEQRMLHAQMETSKLTTRNLRRLLSVSCRLRSSHAQLDARRAAW